LDVDLPKKKLRRQIAFSVSPWEKAEGIPINKFRGFKPIWQMAKNIFSDSCLLPPASCLSSVRKFINYLKKHSPQISN
jgi:hypothetical protein